MPHPPSIFELEDLVQEFTATPEAARMYCCNCGNRRGDFIALCNRHTYVSVCRLCHVMVKVLKVSRHFHPRDQLMAAFDIENVHAALEDARQQHERRAGREPQRLDPQETFAPLGRLVHGVVKLLNLAKHLHADDPVLLVAEADLDAIHSLMEYERRWHEPDPEPSA